MAHSSESAIPYIFIFKALDGSFVKVFSYIAGTRGAYIYPLYNRNMLLGTASSGTYSAFIHTQKLDTLYYIYGMHTFCFKFTLTTSPVI